MVDAQSKVEKLLEQQILKLQDTVNELKDDNAALAERLDDAIKQTKAAEVCWNS